MYMIRNTPTAPILFNIENLAGDGTVRAIAEIGNNQAGAANGTGGARGELYIYNSDTTNFAMIGLTQSNLQLVGNRIVMRGANDSYNSLFLAESGTRGNALSHYRALELGNNSADLTNGRTHNENYRGILKLWGAYEESGEYYSDNIILRSMGAASTAAYQIAKLGYRDDSTSALVLGNGTADGTAREGYHGAIYLYGPDGSISGPISGGNNSNLTFTNCGWVLNGWIYGTGAPPATNSPTGRIYFQKM